MTFFGVVGFVLLRFFYGIGGVIIRVLVCLRVLYFIFTFLSLLSLHKLWGERRKNIKKKERKKKDPRDTLKLRWRHHLYLKKNLDKTNPTTTNKVTNGERCEPHEPSKGVKDHLPLSRSWGPLQSPLMTFLGVVGFILLRSFQRYRWCRYRSFDVPLGFFSFLFLSLSPLSSIYWILYPTILQFESRRWYLRIANAVCDSLNYVIFLNTFCTVLFYQYFFYYAKIKKKKNSWFLHQKP
jgi:hypothetical protein